MDLDNLCVCVDVVPLLKFFFFFRIACNKYKVRKVQWKYKLKSKTQLANDGSMR